MVICRGPMAALGLLGEVLRDVLKPILRPLTYRKDFGGGAMTLRTYKIFLFFLWSYATLSSEELSKE